MSLAIKDGTILQRETETCLRLFAECLRIEELSSARFLWFEDCQARFRWWAFSLKASSTGRGSLDRILAHRSDVRDAIHGVLESLASALDSCLVESRPSDAEDDADADEARSDASSPRSETSAFAESSTSSNSDNDDHLADVAAQHAYFIEMCLRSLMRFSILIRKAKDKLRHKRADDDLVRIQSHEPQTYAEFRTHLETLILFGPYEQSLLSHLDFAVAHQEIPQIVGIVIRAWLFSRLGPVQDRLIQANLIRRHRIMYLRRDRRPPGSISSQVKLVSEQTALPLRPIPSSSRPQQDTRPTEEDVKTDVTPPTPTSHASPKPPSLQTETVLGSELGTAPLRSTQATSVISKLTRTGQNQDYPKTSVLEKSSQCPYCGFLLGPEYTKNEKKWHGHVAHDLSPYTCIFPNCNSPHNLYTTKEQWLAHMTAHHSVTRWFCSTCSFDQDNNRESLFATEPEYQSHMLEHHSSSFAISDLPLLTELAEQKTIEPTSCPLCINDRSLALVEYDDHIAKHLHSFSLRALPWDFDLDEAAASAGSSDSGPASGPQATLDNGHDEPEVNIKSFQDTARNISRAFRQLTQIADGNERLEGLTRTETLQLSAFLVKLEQWAGLPIKWGTTSQRQTCALLLGRVEDNFEGLVADPLDAVHMSDLRTNILLDLEAVEAIIEQPPRPDHDIWRESLRSLSAETQKRVQTIIDDADISSLTTFGYIDTLLNLARRLKEVCSKAALTTELDMAQDIAHSIGLFSKHEFEYFLGRDHVPWVVVYKLMKGASDVTLPIPSATSSSSYTILKFANTLWILQLAFRIATRGRLFVLAYTVANTPEDSVAALHFTLMSLYGTLLELLADRMEPDKSELNEKATARTISDPKTARGPIGRLRFLADQLECEVEGCRQAKVGDVDENVLRLLEYLPLIFPVEVAEEEVSAQSEDELSDVDDDGHVGDLAYLGFDPPLAFEEDQARLRERRVPGTCEWLLGHQDFGSWATSQVSATFSLTGSFGTGKTFLTSAVIDHIRQRIAAAPTLEGFAFSYCDESSSTDPHMPSTLLLSLVQQLLTPEIKKAIKVTKKHASLWDRASGPPSPEQFRGLFIDWFSKILPFYSATTIVLDGLDNLNSYELSNLAATLGPVIEASQMPLRLFLSSVSNRDVSHLASFSALTYQVGLRHWSPHDHSDSERAYMYPQRFFDIDKMVLEEWKEIRPGVRKGVVRQSEGSFLWALAQTRRLRELGADTVTEATLETLPVPDEMTRVFQTARDDLSKLDHSDQTLAWRALRLLLCAGKRVLTSEELLSALRIDPETKKFQLTAEIREGQLRYLCPDLLVLDWDNAEQGTVWRLSHEACATFFESAKPQGHLDAARTHLKLLLESPQDPLPGSPSHNDPIFDRHHALQFSARHHWALHVRAYQDSAEDPDPMLVRLLKRFLGSPDNSSQHYRRWYNNVVNDEEQPLSTAFPSSMIDFIAPETQTLFTMFQFSLFDLLRDWWMDPALDLSARNGRGQTLLQVVKAADPDEC